MLEIGQYKEVVASAQLTFQEAVYMLTFELAGEIQVKGKETVFSELIGREIMDERVEKVFDGKYQYRYIFALKQALGFPTSIEEEKEFKYLRESLKNAFRWAVDYLKRSDVHFILAGALKPFVRQDVATSISTPGSFYTEAPVIGTNDLYERTNQLLTEMMFYKKKFDQAVTEVKALLGEINCRADCPEGLTIETTEDALAKPDLQGSFEQIYWPYRSLRVLRELHIETLAGVIEYFSNFDNFVEGGDMTLWEWCVIVAILQQNNLILMKSVEVELEDKIILESGRCFDIIDGLDTRTANCLCRAGINNVRELISFFTDGAEDGWQKVSEIPQLGRKSYQKLIQTMGSWTFVIPPELFAPTVNSSVSALDLGTAALHAAKDYQIESIGGLMTACQDKNRFRGLRYVDLGLHTEAVRCLEKYGFLDN